MKTDKRILQVVNHAQPIRKAVIEHLLASFEDWQQSDLKCSFEYCATDWFAIQAIESEWSGVSI